MTTYVSSPCADFIKHMLCLFEENRHHALWKGGKTTCILLPLSEILRPDFIGTPE